MPSSGKRVIVIRQEDIDESDIAPVRTIAPDYAVVHETDASRIDLLVEQIEIVHGVLPEDHFDRAVNLRWVNVPGAGVKAWSKRLLRGDVTVTNSAGLTDQPMAETALAMILSFHRRLHLARDYQNQGGWRRDPVKDAIYEDWAPLHRKTLGILGFGSIGRKLAALARGVGMRVLGVRMTPRPDPLAERVVGRAELPGVLAECDYLVCALPETNLTQGILGRREFELMKSSAVVINIGRGSVIDPDALEDALGKGRIRGAGLDVTSPEPLPDDSPLWAMPNVLITPHIGGCRPDYERVALEMFAENLRRYLRGMPLLRKVDVARGY
jgi:phosphoglycerate dehydrogenase-like enzyme